MPHVSLSFLGSFQVSLDRQPVTGFESNKVRALLAYLAVDADRAHSRDELIGLLWPDRSEQAARSNLSQALANLRQAIGDRAAEPPFLHIERAMVQFNTASDHSLDVTAFTTLLAACKGHPHRHPETCKSCAQRLQEATEMYRGDFLEHLFLSDSAAFEEWVLVKRERLRRLALDALYRLAGHHERHGAHEQAYWYASRQLELDPWREEAHRQVMRVLALSGQRSAALAQYETCRRTLDDELGVEPAPETITLYEHIRDGREIGTSSSNLVSLPVPSTPLVGRETELAQLGGLLANPACRLITIVGPGGIGKTRLALAAATEQAGTFTHGAAFVSLASLGSAEFLASTILAALNVPLQGQHSPKDQLLAYLRGARREMLLVLDDFEHLLAGADLLTEMLQQAPDVSLLVTSRERLNLQGEWIFDIQGLRFPHSDPTEDVKGYSAVALFVQQARRVYPGFSFSEREQPWVARICRLVEGMPLAIELAATWVRALSCQEIAGEIEHSLGFLRATWHDVPERHRSVQAVFDHSWHLLSEEEQRVFRRLSIFRGGFERDAAEKVAGASLLFLAALVDKSLLRRAPRDGGRYDMHELLRQFAYEKLQASGETEQTRKCHLDFFLELAEVAEAKLDGVEQVIWLNRLETEHDNLRAAIQWSLESRTATAGLRLAGALYYFWYVRGYQIEGREQLTTILSRPETAQRTAARAKALNAAVGLWQWGRHHYPEAIRLLKEALSIGREVDDPLNIARSMRLFGVAAFDRGDYAAARSSVEEALTILRELEHKPGIARALYFLGDVALYQSDYKRAHGLYEESLQLLRESGEKNQMAYVLRRMGLTLLHRGDHGQALALCKESLTLNQEVGSLGGVVACLAALAALSAARERTAAAAQLLGAVEAQLMSKRVQLLEIDLDQYHQTLAVVRAQLDEATFAAAWGAGRAITLEQAMAYALEIENRALIE